jgi:hypothetical protein
MTTDKWAQSLHGHSHRTAIHLRYSVLRNFYFDRIDMHTADAIVTDCAPHSLRYRRFTLDNGPRQGVHYFA